jgi:methyl-accepting chemotaxis protein
MEAMDAGTQEVVAGTQLAAQAKTHLIAIIEVSREINALVHNITRAASKQVVFAEEVSASMQQVSDISTTTAQKSMEVRSSLDGLAFRSQSAAKFGGEFSQLGKKPEARSQKNLPPLSLYSAPPFAPTISN